MRFALLKGQSQYGSLRLHVDQLAAALVELGHAARVVDMMAEDNQAQLVAAISEQPDCFFGFSGAGCDLTIQGRSAYDELGCVYASMYVDHPVHRLRWVATPIRRYVAFFLDRSHVEFVRASPFAKGISQLDFLPPGANELPTRPELSDEAFARRDIPLMFTGTYRGAPPTPWRQWPDSPAKNLCEQIAERMAADAELAVLDALRASLAKLGAELTPQLFADCAALLSGPQHFAEAHHRDALLQALGQAGAPLHVWGHGWGALAARYPSFVYGGVGSFAETLHLLRRARVVLNINNGFREGGHERVYTAMAAGAAVFSDGNRYYAETFEEGRELASFAWPGLAKAPERLSALLADETRSAMIARAGALSVAAAHRWANRAARLVAAVEQAASVRST